MENHRLIEHRVTIAEAQTGAAFTSIQGRVDQYSLHRAGVASDVIACDAGPDNNVIRENITLGSWTGAAVLGRLCGTGDR